MGKLVDVFVNGKDYYVKKEESLIINNKIVYLYQTIFCEGELQLNNCDIIYSSGVLSKNPAIVAKTGSKVLISNCNIKETGVHKRSFLLAGYNFLLSKETTWKSNKIPAKLSKKNMELYHENKEEIKNAYGMLRNQPANNDKVINNMDDIVISNCKFSNDKSLLGRLANVAHTGILKSYIVLECGGIVENCEFNIDLKCPYGIIRGTYNPRVCKEQNKLKDHVKRKGEITEVYYASGYSEENQYVNIEKSRLYRQTKVKDCKFNKSFTGVYGNCNVNNSVFDKCKTAVRDVYNISNCKFINCKTAMLKDTSLNTEDYVMYNSFENCKKNESKSSISVENMSFIATLPKFTYGVFAGFIIIDLIHSKFKYNEIVFAYYFILFSLVFGIFMFAQTFRDKRIKYNFSSVLKGIMHLLSLFIIYVLIVLGR